MNSLSKLINRNIKIFFRDKGAFFASLISPLILLALFVTFLGKTYYNSFTSMLPEGVNLSERIADGFVAGWLLSSLLAVSCITVAFSANMQMVQDRVTGTIDDIFVSPVKKQTLALSYYISTALITLTICMIVICVGFIYIACVGWYLSFLDCLLILADAILLVLFGTAFASIVCFFLNSQGGISAVSVLVSSMYGFICGAYMPISQFSSKTIQNFVGFLPGTYGTCLFRKHYMEGVLSKAVESGLSEQASNEIANGFDINMFFFDHEVKMWQLYLILVSSVVISITVYVLLNVCKKKRKK